MQNNKFLAFVLGLCSSVLLPSQIYADDMDLMTCMQLDLANGDHAFLKVDNDLRLDVTDGTLHVTAYNPPITVSGINKVAGEGPWKLNYDLSGVEGFRYVNLSLTGVRGVLADAPVIGFKGNILTIETGKSGTCLIYGLDGSMEDSVAFDGSAEIDLSRYGEGVHIIKVNENEPIKINIR